MSLTRSYNVHYILCNGGKTMQGINECYNISCNIGNNSTLMRITELPNKGVREVTNDIRIMSQREWLDIHKKDLILCTHRSRGSLC